MSTDPFAPPESDVAGVATTTPREALGAVEFELLPEHGAKWDATFFERHVEVRYVADEDRRLVFARDELPERATLGFLPNGTASLSLKGKETVNLIVPPGTIPLLRAWLDPIIDEMMQRPMKKNAVSRSFFLVFCLLMVAVERSLFWGILTAWNGVNLVVGLLRPNRILYLMQALFSLGFAAWFGYRGLAVGPWWLAAVAFFIALGVPMSFHRYRFYGATKRGRIGITQTE